MGNVVAIILAIGSCAFAVFAVIKLIAAVKDYRSKKADKGKEENE